jgi:hypothetical protein
MNMFARALMSVLLLGAAGLGAGCSSAGGLVTGSTPAAADTPGAGAKVARQEKFDHDKFWEEMKSRGSQ